MTNKELVKLILEAAKLPPGQGWITVEKLLEIAESLDDGKD